MGRTASLPVLDRVRIASPCPMKWEHMTPVGEGDRIRHCGRCGLNVHNLSSLSRSEAESLLGVVETGLRLCATFYQRSDGAIMTRDCPVGFRAARARMVRLAGRLAAAAALCATGAVLGRSRERERWAASIAELRPFADLAAWLQGKTSAPARGGWLGSLSLSTPQITVPSSGEPGGRAGNEP